LYGNITSKFNLGEYIHISSPGSGVNATGTVLGRKYVAGVGTYITSSLSTNIAPFGPLTVCINPSTSPSSWTGDAIIGGNGSNSQGEGTLATGASSHAEGFYTIATGYSAHAEGYYTKALGDNAHAEGSLTTAIGTYSHAEGSRTIASGSYSHAEGLSNIAAGGYSHVEGYQAVARGQASHAEVGYTLASGLASHAEGYNTVALGSYQHVQGQYNISSSAPSAFIIGNGTSTSARSNLVFASGSQFQITGSLNVTGSITGSLFGTASFATLAYAIPGGTDTQMQYNNNGVLDGTANLTWNNATNTLNGVFSGDGSQLTGLVSPTAQFATSASHAIQADNANTVTGYNHVESSPAYLWTVTHNLGNQYPIVQVYNTDDIMVVPDLIKGVDVNTTIIKFSFAMAGYARIL